MELMTPFGKVKAYVNGQLVDLHPVKLKRSVGGSYVVTDRYLIELKHSVLSKGSVVTLTVENLPDQKKCDSNKRLTAQNWYADNTMFTIGVADYQEFDGELLPNGIEKYCDGVHIMERFVLAWKCDCEESDLATHYAVDAAYMSSRDFLS